MHPPNTEMARHLRRAEAEIANRKTRPCIDLRTADAFRARAMAFLRPLISGINLHRQAVGDPPLRIECVMRSGLRLWFRLAQADDGAGPHGEGELFDELFECPSLEIYLEANDGGWPSYGRIRFMQAAAALPDMGGKLMALGDRRDRNRFCRALASAIVELGL